MDIQTEKFKTMSSTVNWIACKNIEPKTLIIITIIIIMTTRGCPSDSCLKVCVCVLLAWGTTLIHFFRCCGLTENILTLHRLTHWGMGVMCCMMVLLDFVLMVTRSNTASQSGLSAAVRLPASFILCCLRDLLPLRGRGDTKDT